MNIWQYRSITHQKVTVLDNEQIKALPTVPVTVIPALGVGKVIVASAVHGNAEDLIFNYIPGGVIYGNRDGTLSFRFRLGTAGPWSAYANVGLLNNDTHAAFYIPSYNDFDSNGGNSDWHDAFENLPVNFSITNGVLGNLTGGHANNKLIITIGYKIYDMNSREFVA